MSNTTFHYYYSAPENKEVLAIRNKYLPREENKLEELKRLDRSVQSAGMKQALSLGILGCLIFGLGMCLAMKVIGDAVWLGLGLGFVGTVAMIFAYPIYRRIFLREKEALAPRILELAAELSGENAKDNS